MNMLVAGRRQGALSGVAILKCKTPAAAISFLHWCFNESLMKILYCHLVLVFQSKTKAMN
jgi:hypothetical protein